jgi:hypothetical protein
MSAATRFRLSALPVTVALGLLSACEAKLPDARPNDLRPSTASSAAAPDAPAGSVPVTPESPRAERRFGSTAKLSGEPLPVEQLLARADDYVGKHVKCAGKVARVCQNAGCWLELQPAQGGEGLRVPMAGHAFFIPKDALGQLAVVEGALIRQPLEAHVREHYAGEGMKAMGPLSLEATSVVLR